MISKNKKLLYGNSIDVEMTPDGEVYYNFSFENIPDTINILYSDVTNIIDFFNSERGGYILQKAMSNEIHLNIFPTDSIGITEKEKIYLEGHEVLFRRKNIKLFQTWYDSSLKFEYYLGCTIHYALEHFIKHFRNFTFDENKKNKHFLTLNNLQTPNRETLYEVYQNLNENDKNKFICSFRFKKIFLEKNFESFIDSYDLIFGKNIYNHYKDCLIEIVSESSGIAITEKTFKPLIAGLPFIHWISPVGNTLHQIEYLKDIGIDTEYFGIDYTSDDSSKNKIKELLSMEIYEILEVYKKDFEKAQKNKIIFYEFIDSISNRLLKNERV